MVKQYVDLVKEVDEIERASTKVELNQIDISEIQSTQMSHSKPDFKTLLDGAMSVELGKAKEDTPKQKMQQQQQQARQVIQMQVAASAKAAATQSTVTLTLPQPPQEQKPQAPQPPQVQKPSLTESVKGEINTFANKLTQTSEQPRQPINAFKMQIEDVDDLILPKLSTSDQISELERIIEGLEQHAFDKDHAEIVKKEVYGLNKEIIKERKQGGASPRDSTGIEQSLILLRDQRLNEVIAILSGIK